MELHQFAFVSVNCQYCNNLLNVYVFNRPFRRVTDKGALLWDRIHRLEKGKIYQQVAAGVDKDTSSEGLFVKRLFNFYCAYLFTAGKPL